MRTAVICLLSLSLAAFLAGSCATAKEGEAPDKYTEPVKKEPTHSLTSLLPSLEVAGDACYVFIKPEERSPYFGPLVKGEKIKWLDAQGDWIRVWIPRLRISGWISSAKVYEATDTNSSPEAVPEQLLSRVTVIVKRANIREAPTTRSEVIMVAKKHQVFWILNKKWDWYQVWLPNLKKKGWISGKIVARQRKK